MHLLVACLLACRVAWSRGALEGGPWHPGEHVTSAVWREHAGPQDAGLQDLAGLDSLDLLDGAASLPARYSAPLAAVLGEVLRALWGVARALEADPEDPEDLRVPGPLGEPALHTGHDVAQLIRAIKNAIEHIKSTIAHKIKVKKWQKIHFVKAFGVSTLNKVSSLLKKIKIALKKIPVFLLKLLVAKKLFVVKSKLAPLKYFSSKKKALLGLVFPKFVARAAPHPGLLAGSYVRMVPVQTALRETWPGPHAWPPGPHAPPPGPHAPPPGPHAPPLWRPSAPYPPAVDSYGRPTAPYAGRWLSSSLQQPPAAASSLQPHAEGAASVWTSSLQLPDSLTSPGARPAEGVFHGQHSSGLPS
ncbi:uncharacterized protein LOC134534345 [Bacillus rossius redtenbacheri]|uniref:uncharacterized protein LOC134534345 n=1 Tax=Bacillus rossius redtenbacheri TaxID=93214 RepID=UPI002FDD030A